MAINAVSTSSSRIESARVQRAAVTSDGWHSCWHQDRGCHWNTSHSTLESDIDNSGPVCDVSREWQSARSQLGLRVVSLPWTSWGSVQQTAGPPRQPPATVISPTVMLFVSVVIRQHHSVRPFLDTNIGIYWPSCSPVTMLWPQVFITLNSLPKNVIRDIVAEYLELE